MLHTLAPFTSLTPQDFQKRMASSVGLDSVFDSFFNMDVSRDTGYPPYNIRKINDYQYVIEMALAGFSKDDIEVEYKENQLTVKSKPNKDDVEEVDKYDNGVIHRGISKRFFSKSFTIANDVEVKGAELKDGLLKVSMERIIPEHKKAKTIEIK